uniref:Vitellogenin domain-containing protein n=1 Tax=Biomphalaria glabrata TaxID=6526 RepID=A0A2C9LD41_BIOGL
MFACNLLMILFTLWCAVLPGNSLQYDPSRTYTYSYQTDLLLNDANSKRLTSAQKDVGVNFTIRFELSTVYKDESVQLFKLHITKAEVLSLRQPNTKKGLESSIYNPTYFQISGDLVEKIYFTENSIFSRNIKKGIINLFQVQEKEGERTEVEVGGECLVKYSVLEPNVIERNKLECLNLEIANQFSNSNKALGISVYSKATSVYKLQDSVIENVSSTQRVITYLNIRSALNGAALSLQNLQLESVSNGKEEPALTLEEALSKLQAGTLISMALLPSEEEIQQCQEDCQNPELLAQRLEEDLKGENVATLKSAKAFIQMLRGFRSSSKGTLTKIMTTSDSYVVPQLIDIATAAQTDAAKEALLELINFEDADSVDYPQRFLLAAAYSSHPSVTFLEDLLSILKKPIPNESIRESLLLSLGAVVHTFCQVKNQSSHPVVNEFKSLVTSELSACKEERCQLMYLNALGNAGLSSTVEIILPYVESPKSSMLAATAMSAFRRIHKKYITSKVKAALLRIFHQNNDAYDTSVRIAALELIVDNEPTKQEVRNILLSCGDQSEPEFSTYVLKMILDIASVNPELKTKLEDILKDSRIKNYNIWSQSGKSSVITSYLARLKDLDATYNLYFENSKSGVMKRSGMVVSLLGKTIKQPFMKFGIYADGLESLMGQESDTTTESEKTDDDASVEAVAGMSFTFMDVLLTQVEFFRGMSGLMSAAWNAPSELTSALQANVLLQDHSQRIHLSNGLVLDTEVKGVLSFDLSGFVSISLWNRNCDALIRNSGAMYIEGSMKADSSVFNLGLMFSGEGQTNIDYTSKADFYEMPLKLCMQMLRPEFEFVHKTQKTSSLSKGRKYKSSINRKLVILAESYLLNKANSDECRVMLSQE